ncbi:hypothetical protein [Plantactinospora sp. GCM10030261]|uniref:DUF6197 family protein n=1 Tax=Plantactinospora sp. GCM10030261 TaxID=3273420 RepID=UPI003607ECDA
MNPTHNPPRAALGDITPADILRCAAHYLQTHGWIQGNYYPPTTTDAFPSACVVGAISMATFGRLTYAPLDLPYEQRRDFNRALDVLIDYLTRTEPCDDDEDPLPDDDRHSPFEWNDRPGRTLDQVLTTLTEAADDYDWTHATEEDLETYADACVWAEKHPTREGFLAWLGAR